MDDDLETAGRIQRALSGVAARVEIARDAETFKKRILTGTFDVVFVSVALDLRSVLGAIIGRPGTAPAIIAVGDPQEAPSSWDWVGSDRYLSKPLDPTRVAACAQKALAVRRAWLTLAGNAAIKREKRVPRSKR